jgi:hypothetical protein
VVTSLIISTVPLLLLINQLYGVLMQTFRLPSKVVSFCWLLQCVPAVYASRSSQLALGASNACGENQSCGTQTGRGSMLCLVASGALHALDHSKVCFTVRMRRYARNLR